MLLENTKYIKGCNPININQVDRIISDSTFSDLNFQIKKTKKKDCSDATNSIAVMLQEVDKMH